MVGVTGIEPAASTSQMSRATNCATPRFILSFTTMYILSNYCRVVKAYLKNSPLQSAVGYDLNNSFRLMLNLENVCDKIYATVVS